MVVFAPMLVFAYVYSPAMLSYQGELQRFIRDPDALDRVFLINLVFVGVFCAGCLLAQGRETSHSGKRFLRSLSLDSLARHQLFNLACVLGSLGALGFAYMVYRGGGLVEVFSRPKAFLSAPSGYIGEMPMLSYAAIALMAVTLQGRRIRIYHVAFALWFASPHLIMAILGGRRGPAFLILCTLVVSWYVARRRRPSLLSVTGGVVALGLLMLFLVSNRHNVYLGSEQGVDRSAFEERVLLQEASGGQEFIFGAGMMLTAEDTGRFYWGKRYFATFFVRPIPRQIWPTKYEDLRLGWMVNQPGTGGFSDYEWRRAVGFLPLRGSAGGFVADLYLELWWFGAIACFLIGWVYGRAWSHSVTHGGVWMVIYVELLALSVYLPTQSLGAWLTRVLMLVVPTWLIWKRVVEPRQRLRPKRPYPIPSSAYSR